jgi:hypothetical protein
LPLKQSLALKLASIVFFDKKEDIADYDFQYNKKKIEHWKKHDGSSFFLHQPLQKLMPFLNDVSGNLNLYSQVVEKLNNLHLDNLLLHLPNGKIVKQKR